MRRKPRRDLLDLSIVVPAAHTYNSLPFFFRTDFSLSLSLSPSFFLSFCRLREKEVESSEQ